MARVERRTALSLRPLIAKSYVDRSPMTCNSDDSDAVGVRRSTRQRNFQYKEMSWITDQMPKKGYPNAEYSEDDSRDVQTRCNTTTRRLPEATTRSVRNEIDSIPTRREIKKNTKYLHDYETTAVNTSRRRSRNEEEVRTKPKRPLRNHREIYNRNEKDKVAILPTRVNGRLSKSSTLKPEGGEEEEEEQEEEEENGDDAEQDGDEEDEEGDDVEDEEQQLEDTKTEKQDNKENKKNNTKLKLEVKPRTKDQSSESDIQGVTTRKSNTILDDTFSPRRTRRATQKVLGNKPMIHIFFVFSKNSKTNHSKNEQQPLKSGAGGSKVIPIGPETLDSKIRFSSVGGLDSHIQCLKEMVLLPMMYPEVFDQFQIQPPRGVLFYGPPGTGKTLIARALANECCFGSRKIAFFMRKGADLLSKWIGESEKQLRLLFEQAKEMKPSIIFFDELDGLAPVRSSRQDQIHASIVSTLLALMDGLDNRGEVIVIGATNRIDAIDPALRRPGRFDRELYFPLPSKKEREEILGVHVSQWVQPPNNQLLNYLAENAVGYCGSDLRALCSEAVIHSFRRTYPQVYNAEHKLLLNPKNVKVEKLDFVRAKAQLIPSSHRTGQRLGRKLLLILKPLLENAFREIFSILEKTFPHGVHSNLAKVKLSSGIRPAQLLLVGDSPDHGQTVHLAPAILYDMEHIHAHILDLTMLYSNSTTSPEEACVRVWQPSVERNTTVEYLKKVYQQRFSEFVFHEVRRNVPSVLYIPAIDEWWSLISDTVKVIFLSQLSQLDPNSPILLLATANDIYSNLPQEVSTGKTLIARALANECCFGSRKIAFFMRKGADLLSKWIGESEKQLRLLFEQAKEMKPSIIFFDELDGLAPVRSSRQDQIHASIVSTLLALMDGLDNRGEVIVIGATNRIDAIDPALRRPGRFDRELYFPLPSKKEREEILGVHVSQWVQPPNNQLLNYLAENAVGYCGSDLRALCSEAVIHSFRRTYPQVYNAEHKLLLNPKNVKVEKLDFVRAKAQLIPSSHRTGQRLGRKLLLILKPLLENAFREIFSILEKTFPHGVHSNLAKVKLSSGIRPAQLLLVGDSPDHGQTVHLAPAILYDMEHIHAHILDLTMLYSNSTTSPEEACVRVFHEVRRNVPSVLYIPAIDEWWSLISDTVKVIFLSQLSQLDPNSPILLLATANDIYSNLPQEIQNVFSSYRNEIYELTTPTEEQRRNFFRPLLTDSCLKQPRSPRFRPKTPPSLPRAPTPAPAPLSEAQKQKVFETEEHTLRELRIFLREICKKLANNRLFYMFTKPVDTEEVPDYPTIIKQPMDLETMMTKVDFHQYECAKDFLNDIELIVQNALEYNPAK
ncbi:aaa domain-containing [Holotrichia oblita]|uniref:Aaa domain-containing n=1 Tax=Holotrichia oblita TaxID=644536 RepID=A0ACB9TND3_HOLOL|nr:aaa domain-containing [Holotrichia oblita]